VRCRRCGNDNAETNRFCGMCGAALVAPADAKADVAGQSRAPQAVSAAASHSDAASKTVPAITGPSFLGLSTPGPARPGHDRLQPSSRNLDYLLEDDEEPKRGGGKLILVLLALALAVGFGYLHWKHGGFDWLNTNNRKAAAAKPTPDSTQAPDSGGQGTAATPNGAIPQAGASEGGTAPTTPGSTPNPGDSAPGQPTPSQSASSGSARPNTSSQNTSSQAPVANTAVSNTGASNAVPQNNSSDSSAPADSASQPASSDSAPSPSADIPKAKARKPAPAKPAAAVPFDAVSEAERYIYGRGARQDCDHGIRLLRSAAEQSNPKAMISLGALYSTGTCTPRDLPTAYHWFALALHKQPDNQALQEDLKNLWEKMTQPERQLAIKLNQ